MYYDKTKKWTKFCDRVFDRFAEYFEYAFVFLILIVIQFVIEETLVYHLLSETKIIDSLIYSFFHFLLLLSAFFYGCSRVSCRSYISCKESNHGGLWKYRKRAAESFFTGLSLFILSLIMLLAYTYFKN